MTGPVDTTGGSQDVIIRFLTSDTRSRMRLILDPVAEVPLRAWLGDDAYAEYCALAAQLGQSHLGGSGSPNLIFVPGLMGSLLTSGGLGGMWWIDARSRGHLNDLRLAPDGLTDAEAGHRVAPAEVDQSYENFFKTILKRGDFEHVGFPYDWRKPPTASASRLREAILAAYSDNGERPIHLVSHSMGGLMVRATLLSYPDLWSRLGKIVCLGTPHYGSPAIAGYLKNHLWGFTLLTLLGKYLDRATFRSMWGVIGLLPAPAGIYPGTRTSDGPIQQLANGEYLHPCANFDLYQASAYHLDLDTESEEALQTVLDGAARMHRELYEWHVALDQGQRDRMLVVVGVGFKTLFRLAYEKRLGFLWEHMDKVTRRQPGDPDRDGDGRVPQASAELEWVGETRYAPVVHGSLPTVPAVYEDVLRFLTDQPMQLPTTAGGALAAHLGGDMRVETPTLAGTLLESRADDPGYLELGAPDEDGIAEAENMLNEERLPAFNRLHIL